MPSLNIKGNVLEDFGTQLPNVVIESVNIKDASLDVLVSLYFNFEEDITATERDEYISDFDNTEHRIYVYVGYILGEQYLDALINKENTDIWSEFYSPTETSPGTFTVPGGDWYVNRALAQDDNPNYIQTAFNTTTSGFALSNQNFYDEDDNRIFQYSATINIPIGFSTYSRAGSSVGGGFSGDLSAQNSIFSLLSSQFQDMAVTAYTSWIDLDTSNPADASSGTVMVEDTDPLSADHPRSFNYITPDLMPSLKRQMTSDISYAKVFTGGNVDSGIKSAYMDSAGGSYNNTPVQAINGKFYKQDAYSLEQIRALFSSYVSTVIVEDKEVQSVLDNITYVVETFGESSQLLLELNILRKAFPEKSTATAVGRLYEGFKGRFFGANEKVAAGTPVVEKLYKSSKVRDTRGVPPIPEMSGENQDPSRYNYIYPYKAGGTAAYPGWDTGKWMSAVQVYTAGNYGQPTVSQHINTGFWFFDYGFALKQHANILSAFTLQKVNDLFGDRAIQKYFWVSDVQMYKWQYEGDDDRHMAFTGTEELKPLMYLSLTIGSSNSPGYRVEPKADRNTYLNNHENSLLEPADDNCWLMMRGIQGLEIDEDHKLMCFQYQDIEKSYYSDYDGSSYDKPDERKIYSFALQCHDETHKLLAELPDSFNSYYDADFTNYYSMATENCSYNITDGTFNDFFKNGIMVQYGELAEDHPWVVMPLILNIHRDLLTGEFGGDEAKMKESAAATAAQINPINGTLPALDAFKEQCESFREIYYGSTSPIGRAIDEGERSGGTGRITHYFGGESGHEGSKIFAKPPSPLSTVDSEWTWEPPANPEATETEHESVDIPIATWVEDPAYVRWNFGINFDNWSGDRATIAKKIIDKWDWDPNIYNNGEYKAHHNWNTLSARLHRDHNGDYESQSGNYTGPYASNTGHTARFHIVEKIQNKAEDWDRDNDCDGTVSNRKCTGWLDGDANLDGAQTRYRGCITCAETGGSNRAYDQILVNREVYKFE